ncbi:FHA domain-containing protein [Nitriliruptoraceae bacterium ZYF776]|nr:FHA domain-containing protein [Profundirhabdus halotolerans]
MLQLSIRPPAGTDLVPVDVALEVHPDATVEDLATALGAHVAPDRQRLLLAPTRDGRPLPAGQRLTACRLRTGDVVDVTPVPPSWRQAPGAPPRERAVVRVLAGPDAGRDVPVAGGEVTIGRGAGNAVTLADPLVSRRHARVLLDPEPMVVDEGSAHGTTVDGTPIHRATPVGWGRPIGVGDSVLVLHPTAGAPTDADRGVVRPPRFGEPLRDEEVELPDAPSRKPTPPVPWTTVAMPLVLGLAMLATMRSAFVLVYLLGWPALTYFGHREQKRRAAREFEEELAIWRADVDAVLAVLDRHADAQRARAAADHPELTRLRDRVVGRDPLLWTRRAGDDDFLAVRAGLGPVPARLTATVGDGGDREVTAGLREELADRATLADQPVLVPLGVARLTAITGPPSDVDDAARALLARLCVDHSPADVTVTAVLGRDREGFETWLRWLPHVSPRAGGLAAVAFGPTEGQRLLERLADEDGGRGVTVCLVDETAGVPRRTVETIASVAAGRRLHLVWLGADPDRVPASTDLLVDLTASVPIELSPPTEHEAVVAVRDRGGVAVLRRADRLALTDAWHLARGLAGCTDEAAVLPADTALPEQVRLPELTADLVDLDDAAAVAERWSSSRGLKAVIGAGVDGAVALDLREDGPHGLVAGTTGSGKSELLQTLICSLALHNPPQRLTFLLVDYKGGAAFRECADLPHTVGYITDLSPALVQRALTSLGAEIAARELLLDAHGAKDLAQLEREHPEVAPPSLLICVDEFAALTAEVPEFVDGVVNIAQRGRSLGLHLLLATQRPAGVVTANIKANTDLRIALRVGAADDSQDVIDAPDAAHLSRRTPGRAWIRRTGHGTAELVQTAWVGAREPVAGGRDAVEVHPFSARPDTAGVAPALETGTHERTDLERLVDTVRAAEQRWARPAPSRPWLPPLPTLLALTDDPADADSALSVDADAGTVTTPTAPDAPTRPARGQVPVGLVDDPHQRRQPAWHLDYPGRGHVLVHGASGSGKTELLRTVAIASGLAEPELPPHVYVLDFAGGGLRSLEAWPTVGAVIGASQLERAMRLLRVLDRTVTERSHLLAAAGASDLDELAAAGRALPRIHVLIDDLAALLDALEGGGSVRRQHAELLHGLVQNGRRAGVHVTATAATRSGLPSGLTAGFGTRVVLRMTVEDDYAMLGVPLGVLTAESPAGRGLLGPREVQIARVPADADVLERLAASVATSLGERLPTRVLAMPTHVPHTALAAPSADGVAIGVEADAVSVVQVPLRGTRFLVTGRDGSGRTGMLRGLAALLRRAAEPPAEIAFVGPSVAAHPDAADVVLDDPATAAELAARWGAAGDGAWRVLLLDDLHVWERAAERDPAVRAALTSLAELAEAAPALGVAVVVATDPDDARSRSLQPGLVAVVKRSRTGVLLQPDAADGGLLGVTIPLHTVEPLGGPGRGLACTEGELRVVQTLAAAEASELGR